ncbi:hypothetical protein CP061683_0462B, partial [Chlamydia psittaci 06-1683]
TKL